MGPEEPRQPAGEGARRPSDDDDTFGYDDPAFNEGPEYSRSAAYSDSPRYSPGAGYSPSAGYGTDEYPDEYEAPVFSEEELSGLDGNSGPRRVLPLEDDFFFGTFPPARRASERPIAMACLRLVTFLPEPPERRVPRLRSYISRPAADRCFHSRRISERSRWSVREAIHRFSRSSLR